MTKHSTTKPAPRLTVVITYTDTPPRFDIRIELVTPGES
ncbi:hypothetical protein DES52_11779 [Deinococcus yavapaiensis KR-236]|uniref:Uncharacterized protein n=1 Tax=Deinococcus yavapaiensis KR-236 TaxID=694435 RepID=A0A318S750_9DEIO|nr:hypothetical protein DES52_11779 [Deinococcus yavapaiensis KR-236]